MKLCRICLTCEGRLYSMSKYGLEPIFKALTGIPTEKNKRLPLWVCAECGLRLMSSNRLREKSIISHHMLCDVLRKIKGKIEHINWNPDVKETRLSYSGTLADDYDPSMDSTWSASAHKPTLTDIKVEYEPNCSEIKVEINQENSQNDLYEQEFSQNYVRVQEISQIANDLTFHDNDNTNTSNDDKIKLSRVKQKRPNHEQKVPKIKPDQKQKHKQEIDQKSMGMKTVKEQTKKIAKTSLLKSMYTKIAMSNEQEKAEVLERQFSSQYKDAEFKCTDCFKGFRDKEIYKRHTFKHSQEAGPFICDICKNRYLSRSEILSHITKYHAFKYKCKRCPYICTTCVGANRHALSHMGKKYECTYCSREFINHTTHLNHMRARHNSQYICALCGFSFVSAIGVQHHKKLKHRFDDPNMVMQGPHCTNCDIKFATKEAYDNHYKYSAKHLVKVYDPSLALQLGVKRPVVCEKCDEKLDSQSAYFKHFKMFHPKEKPTRTAFMCEECGGFYKSKIALQEHKRTHTKERPFACAQCGRAFTQKQALLFHETIHDENRTLYPCHLCDKAFAYRNNLRRHIIHHSGLKEFECESCGKKFKTKAEKQSHYDYVHLKKPWPKRDRNRRVVSSASGTSELK